MNSHSGSPRNSETNDLIAEVFRLSALLNERAGKLVARFGITGARWQVLRAISMCGDGETVSRIARNMGLTRQSVQRLVNEMVDDDILVLRENPHHQRAKLVGMTRKGMRTFDAVRELQIPWVEELSRGISKARLTDARDVLLKMRQRIEAETG